MWPIVQSFSSKPKVPVFILGCQRSGTSICQNVFVESKRLAIYREGNKDAMTNGWRLRPIADIQDLIDRSRAKTIIFKPINDSQSALQFLERFDNSRIIWIYRDFYDTANSAVKTWGSAQRDMVVLIGQALAKYGCVEKAMPTIARMPSYAVYAERLSPATCKLLAEWTDAPMSDHTGAAIMWYLRNLLFLDQNLDANEQTLLVNYEMFVSRPDEQIRRIYEFVGVRYSRRRSENVYMTSVGKNEVPNISTDVLQACEDLFNRLNRSAQTGRCTDDGRLLFRNV